VFASLSLSLSLSLKHELAKGHHIFEESHQHEKWRAKLTNGAGWGNWDSNLVLKAILEEILWILSIKEVRWNRNQKLIKSWEQIDVGKSLVSERKKRKETAEACNFTMTHLCGALAIYYDG
jgi:hypothetical protein